MTDRRKHADRRATRGPGFVDTWIMLGPFIRILFCLAILLCFLWSVRAIFEMILWLRVLLG